MDFFQVKESRDFLLLTNKAMKYVNTKQPAHIKLGLELLEHTLIEMFGKTDIQLLVQDEEKYIQTFSESMSRVLDTIFWSRSTKVIAFSNMKKVLRETSISDVFVKKLTMKTPVKNYCPIIGKKYSNIPHVKMVLQKWIDILKTKTKNRSDSSIKNIINFFIRLSKNLDIDIHDWGNRKVPILNKDIIVKLTDSKLKKLRWLKIFYEHILEVEVDPTLFLYKREHTRYEYNDGSDKHFIKPDELDLLYVEAKKDIKSELIFLLFITTGLRIGGLCRIRLENIIDSNGSIKDVAKTLEKGNKWFTFMLNSRVKNLVLAWVKTERITTISPYLFPNGKCSVNDYISTSYIRSLFRKMCSNAGLTGTHLHPHSLRHSYAHILLEMGNNVSVISKLLGHTNISTTESYYLKEDAASVAQRANIPWLDNTKKKKMIPDFLASMGTKNNDKEDVDKKNRMRRRNMLELKDFKII